MKLFKVFAFLALGLNCSLIPFYIVLDYLNVSYTSPLYLFFLITSYTGVISLIFFVCLSAVHIRSGFKGTRLMVGNRHLHEGTIGIVLVINGVIWNIWHYFDASFHFPYGAYATVGWWLAVGGLILIMIGAILIGRDWEDIKHGRFFNKEEE
ncbi:MAG: hypothetical protein ACTSYB_09635 [Candidatus Helarchaeota archaeon]